MDIPEKATRAELTIRRSKFIADLITVPNRRTAEEAIQFRRAEHPNADHVVYAYITGDSRSEVSGMSDDGEPRGTAGRPVHEILKGSGLTNTIITVVRYFGGTKLGTGGLVRAYGDAARAALEQVTRIPYRILKDYRMVVPYDLYQAVRQILTDNGGEILKEQFLEQVYVVVSLEERLVGVLNGDLKDVSRGTLQLTPVDQELQGTDAPSMFHVKHTRGTVKD